VGFLEEYWLEKNTRSLDDRDTGILPLTE